MIEFKVNGKKVKLKTQWDELTLLEYCEILKGTPSRDKLISICSGIDCEILKNAVIIGLDQVLIALSAFNKVPEIKMPTQVGPFMITNPNIQFESLAMFEDMKAIMLNAPKDLPGFTLSYADMCAIYLQKIRDGQYSYDKAKAMAPEVAGYPALEIIGLGSFFLNKLLILINGITPSSHHTTPSLAKSKRDITSSKKRLGPTGRSRKHR